ncbi:hypothetical protein VP01_2910g1 [Puccinia sorghi]|uniref:Uncharacterized protein n=1 Tax=Puccinia sorghi TaxID=27349 RepID=A0A0L6V1F2_9BASI|nr:hypothetical protein VP01_2910g1 [Puccinia sorghi]
MPPQSSALAIKFRYTLNFFLAKQSDQTKKSFAKFRHNRSKVASLVYENTWEGIISSGILRSRIRNEDSGKGFNKNN